MSDSYVSDTQQFCTFFLNGLHFGVPVSDVQEVLRFQDMTPAPLASEVVAGLINLRGDIVTAIDLRRRMDMPDRPDDMEPMNVVVRAQGEVLSLLVDEIGDVLTVDGEMFEEPPETVEGVARELIRGVFKLDGRLLLVLDTEKTVQYGGSPVA